MVPVLVLVVRSNGDVVVLDSLVVVLVWLLSWCILRASAVVVVGETTTTTIIERSTIVTVHCHTCRIIIFMVYALSCWTLSIAGVFWTD